MKNLKNTKGITLIALVITIIVLLILTGITIATLTGDNGLLTKAGNAKNTANDAEIMEKIKLAYQDYYLGQHTNPGYSFQVALDKMFETGVATVVGEGPWTVIVGDKGYTLATDGTVTLNSSNSGSGQESGTGGTSQAISTITSANYGDYIDLGQDVVKTSATTDDWRILYNDTTNNVVYAILADYLPNNNAAVTATGLDTDGIYAVLSGIGKETLLAGLNNAAAWQSLIPEELRSRCQVKGATTAEILMASWNEKYGTNFSITDYPSFITDPNDGTSIDELYMPHPSANENCYGYWLSSPGNDDSETVWFVSNGGGFGTDDYWYTSYTGVCPVVSLPSSIQVTNNNGVWSIAQ